jgi:hypothetical protein
MDGVSNGIAREAEHPEQEAECRLEERTMDGSYQQHRGGVTKRGRRGRA